MTDHITDEESAFMLKTEPHAGESWEDFVTRQRGIVRDPKQGEDGSAQKTVDGHLVFEQTVPPQYAMDALVPDRADEASQQAFDSLPKAEQAREARNAQGLANILNANPDVRNAYKGR